MRRSSLDGFDDVVWISEVDAGLEGSPEVLKHLLRDGRSECEEGKDPEVELLAKEVLVVQQYRPIDQLESGGTLVKTKRVSHRV